MEGIGHDSFLRCCRDIWLELLRKNAKNIQVGGGTARIRTANFPNANKELMLDPYFSDDRVRCDLKQVVCGAGGGGESLT
jgi:hypothetical protein